MAETKTPIIYILEDSHYPGWIKIAKTTQNPDDIIRKQYGNLMPYGDFTAKITHTTEAIKHNGKPLSDFNILDVLQASGFKKGYNKWIECTTDIAIQTIENIKNGLTINQLIERIKVIK